MTISSYEELLGFLRNWRAWNSTEVYDFGGAVHLLAACLSNIFENALEAEIDDLADYLDAREQKILIALAGRLTDVRST